MSPGSVSLQGQGVSLISGANVDLSADGVSLDTDGVTLFKVGVSLTGTSTSDYVGPGDIVSGATAAYSLRAYNAAAALPGTTKAVNVRRASDNATKDILILPDGNLDVATANAFAGTDATGSATTTGSSTTVAITGASSTPHVGSTLTGAGISAGCYVTSVGTFVAGAGTVVVSTAQNIAIAEPVTFTWGLYVTEWYDQSGNGNNATQSTAGDQPQLLLGGSNGRPAVSFAGAQYLSASASLTELPWSFIGIALRSGGTGAFGTLYVPAGDGSSDVGVLYDDVPNSIAVYFGNILAVTANDNAVQSYQIVIPFSGNATVSVDGTVTSGVAGNFVAGGGTAGIGASATGVFPLTGLISEVISYNDTGFTPTQMTAIQANEKAYWATP
jgi:hypothetical protein